jgi:hypothetical protein
VRSGPWARRASAHWLRGERIACYRQGAPVPLVSATSPCLIPPGARPIGAACCSRSDHSSAWPRKGVHPPREAFAGHSQTWSSDRDGLTPGWFVQAWGGRAGRKPSLDTVMPIWLKVLDHQGPSFMFTPARTTPTPSPRTLSSVIARYSSRADRVGLSLPSRPTP